MRRSNKNIAIKAIALSMLALLFFSVLAAYLFLAPRKFSGEVERAASAYGIEAELLYAVIRTESNFRPDAVSSAGAVGLMQLMPQTARFIEQRAGISSDLYDPAANICAGAWYLQYLFSKFEGEREAFAAYNAGEGTVRAWLRDPSYSDDGKHLMHIPYLETEQYISKINFFRNCYKFLY